jgi:neutral ceramidase
MKIGIAESNITPPLGMNMPGQFHERLASGIKDDIYAKSMVIEAKGTLAAFIVIDSQSLNLEPMRRIRERVAQFTSIPQENIMISVTHTHTGPPLGKNAEDFYSEIYIAKAADAAIIAYGKRIEAQIGFGRGNEDEIAFNRRFEMKDGTFRTNPGIGNPDIVRAIGPIDPEVAVARIDDLEGNPLGVISNYACHCDTVGGMEYSADYPGVISKKVKKTLGQNVISLFFQGACGNINHIDVTGKLDRTPGRHHIMMGNRLGAEIISVREKIKTSIEMNLAVASRKVEISTRVPLDKEISLAKETIERLKDVPDAQLSNRDTKDKKIANNTLRVAAKEPSIRDYEVQVICLGKLAVVAFPGEVFVEYGLETKEKSPFSYVMTNYMSNGSGNGYVCTRIAYDQGGYEPTGSAFEIGAGEKFVEAALELLEEIS